MMTPLPLPSPAESKKPFELGKASELPLMLALWGLLIGFQF